MTLRQYVLLPLAFLAGILGLVVLLDINGSLRHALARAAATPASSNKLVYLLSQTNWILAITILVALIGWGLYLYMDYHAYRRPLVREVPSVHYTLSHHLKVVSLPKVYYNWRPLAIKSALIPVYTLVYTVASIFALMHVFALAPTVSTQAATGITSSGASLHGTVSSSDQPVNYRGFEYGTDTNYGQTIGDSSATDYQADATYGSQGSSNGQFDEPVGIAIDAQNNYYVSDRNNHRIQKFQQDGTHVWSSGQAGSGDGEFVDKIYGLAIDSSGSVLVVDGSGKRIQKFNSSDGTYQSQFGNTGTSIQKLDNPTGIAVGPSGDIYVGDNNSTEGVSIVKFDANGNYLNRFGSFTNIFGVTVNSQEKIFASDFQANVIKMYDSDGTAQGQFGSNGTGDGAFNFPGGIAVDGQDNLYVSDFGNDRVQKFGSDNGFIAKFGTSGSGSGQLSSSFYSAVNSLGAVYVVDSGNNRVERFVQRFNVGAYSSTVSALACNTTYHFRAFATSSDGTNYGSDQTFQTANSCPLPAPGSPVTGSGTTGNILTGATVLVIGWGEPDTNGGPPITNYVVQYKPHDSSTWVTFNRVEDPNTARIAAITHLIPGTMYDFRVAPVSSSGQGDWTTTSSLSTIAQTTYHITNCQQLQNMFLDPDGKYLLDNDIDCAVSANWGTTEFCSLLSDLYSGYLGQISDPNPFFTTDYCTQGFPASHTFQGFVPIGWMDKLAFMGTLDGQGHSISNLTSTGSWGDVGSDPGCGLIGWGFGTTVSNLHLDNLSLSCMATTDSPAGGLIGGGLVSYGTSMNISDVTVSGNMAIGSSQASAAGHGVIAGGLAGFLDHITGGDDDFLVVNGQGSQIDKSVSNMNIVITAPAHTNPTTNSFLFVGGLVASVGGSHITNSYAAGTITINGGDYPVLTAGLVAWEYLSSIANSYSSSTVVATGDDSRSLSGGLVGYAAFSTITNSFSSGTLNAPGNSDNPSGGLVGVAGVTTMTNNYFDIYRTGFANCAGAAFDSLGGNPVTVSSSACQGKNANNSDPGYFIYNHTHEPLGSWDFNGIWRTNANALPTLGQNTVPDPPRNLGGTAKSSSVTINWQTPYEDGGRPIVNYLVQYRAQGSSTWQTHPHSASTTREYEITGLEANKTYEFQIAAINEIGQSSWVLGVATIKTTGTTPVDPVTPTTKPTTSNPKSTPGSSSTPPVTSQTEVPQLKTPGISPVRGEEAQPTAKTSSSIFNILPWLLILLLLILAILYLYRALREYRLRIALQAELKRAQNLAEALKTFINIVSHYLNTPYTIMGGALELMTSNKLANEAVLDGVNKGLQTLKAHLDSLLTDGLKVVAAPDAAQATVAKMPKSSWKEVFSPSVAIPIAAAILCIVLAEVAGIRVHSLNRPGLVVALSSVAVVLIVGLIVLFEHFRLGQKGLRAQLQRTLDAETQSITQRSSFMQKVATTLRGDHSAIETASAPLARVPQSRPLFNGLAMLKEVIDTTNKFDYFASIPAVTAPLAIGPILSSVRTTQQPFAETKNIKVLLTVPTGLTAALNSEQIIQLSSSLINNAIKFGNKDSAVQVAAYKKGKNTIIKVTNRGLAIDQDKLVHLFEPFSRATSTELYNYEGLGVNLFVDKIIAQQVNGSLTLTSNNQATTFTVTVPTGKKSKSAPELDHTNVIRPTVVGNKL